MVGELLGRVRLQSDISIFAAEDGTGTTDDPSDLIWVVAAKESLSVLTPYFLLFSSLSYQKGLLALW